MKWFKELDFDGSPYKIYKPIMWFIAFITFSLVGYALFLDSFSGATHGYSYCPTSASEGCFNAFYNNSICYKDKTVFLFFTQKGLNSSSELCSVKHMLAGQELGDKPPFLIDNMWMIVIVIAILGMIVNHLIFNMNYKKKSKESIEGKL